STHPATSKSIVGVLSPRKSRNTCKNGTSSQSTLIFGPHTYERRQWCGVCAAVREESLYEEMPSDDKENIMTIHARKSQLLVHQEHSFNAEPPGDLLRQSFLTPREHFYVRTHGSIPAVATTSYRLFITGLVQRKRELSLTEL